MITFREKLFNPAALLTAGKGLMSMEGLNAGMMGLSLFQGHKQNKMAEEQAEEQMQEQRRLQNQQIKAQAKQNQKMIDALNKVAKQNPAAAGAGAAAMMQQQFAIPANVANTFKTVKGAAKDLAIVGKQMGLGKNIARGAALGATAAGASYIVDKAIQADAKRSGIDLGPTEDTRKDHRKTLGKAAGALAATGLAIAGAKRGYFGNNIKNTANKFINKTNIQKAGNTVKDAFKEQFVNTDKWNAAKGFKDKAKAINVGGIALSTAFAAGPAISYLGTKKAMKDQAKQSEQSGEMRTYSAGIKTPNLRTLTQGAKKFINNKVRPAMQKSTLPKLGSDKPVASFKEAPVRKILGGISSFFGGGGQQGTAEFTSNLMAQGAKSGNKITQGAAKFLDNHKTLAVGGSIAVGSALMKPWEIGSNTIKNITGAVDKNSMKYEKSQNKQVEEE